MADSRLDADRIIALTAAIEAARETLRTSASPAARERLVAAESEYKAYLTGLNGLEGRQPSSAEP